MMNSRIVSNAALPFAPSAVRGARGDSLPRSVVLFTMAAILSMGTGCASFHARDVQKGHDGDQLTVARVQSEIAKGMSGGEVIEALGSPNIITTDENGLEVWVFDRIATDATHSSSGGLLLGGVLFGSGGGIGGGSVNTGASSKSQRTLTVIIKFNADRKVRDFAYHASRF